MNIKPISIKPIPVTNSMLPVSKFAATSLNTIDPVAPYTRAIPKRSIAEEKPPRMRYLIPASVDLVESLFNAVRTYTDIDIISKLRNRLINSLDAHKNIMPEVANSKRE